MTRAQAKAKDKEERFCGIRDEIFDPSQTFLHHNIDFNCHSDSLKKNDSVGNVETAMDVSLSKRQL